MNIYFKDVRAYCYCASLVRTLNMAWPVPVIRQQFQLELRNVFRILQKSDQNDMGADDQQSSEQPDRTKALTTCGRRSKLPTLK